MLFKAFNKELVKDREKTYLTDSVDAADTALTVKAIDTNAWADNDWVIVGEIGAKNAEILQVNDASLADGTTLTIDNAGSGGARYAHSIDEPVYRVDFNQVEFSRAATIDGSKSVLATNEIQPDELFTRYEDTSNSTGFGFVRFKNSATSTFSVYSVGVPYTGYTAKSLFRLVKNVRRLLNSPDEKTVSDEDIIDELNEKQRDVTHERLWTFGEADFSFSAVASTSNYEVPSRIAPGKVHTLAYDSQPLAKINQNRWEMLHFDSNSTGDPTHFGVFGNRVKTWPITTTAASSTTLNGAISATDTTITLTSVSGFRDPGRALIESEVISYDRADSTNNQLLGCRRGLEGTTAASHSDTTAITERDFVGTGHLEPTELVDMDDETLIPDPRVIEYGASMEIAGGLLNNQSLHDRLENKYDKSLDRLRDKFGAKMTGSAYRIMDKEEYPTPDGAFRDPNDFRTLS